MYDSLTREVSVREIRRQLSETLDSVQHMKERVAVTRRGKLVGVLIPLDDFAVLEEIEDSFLIDSPIAEEFRSIATVRSLIRDFNVWRERRESGTLEGALHEEDELPWWATPRP